MEKSKIKNVIILILLTVNIFFLALFLIGRTETGKLKRQAREDVASILAENGIRIDQSIIPEDSYFVSYKLTRDINGENLITKTVLGDTDTNLDGSIYHYESLAGKADFYGSGEFAISITDGYPISDSNSQGLVSFLKSMNIAVDPGSVRIENTAGGAQTVSFFCSYSNTRIFNCPINLNISDGRIYSINGRRPTSAPLASGSPNLLSVNTALVYFLNGIRNANLKCGEITGISAGYYMSAAVSGGGELYPVWLLTTDSGSYYVNGINGEIAAAFD